MPGFVETADHLAAAYLLDERGETARKHLCETLASSDGQIRVMPASPSAVRMRLRFNPDARRLVAGLERHQVGLQAQTVGRALWGLSLQVAAPDLVSLYREDGRGGHYDHEEIPWSVVAWARETTWVAWWLHRYARFLAARYTTLFGRDHRSISPARLKTYANAVSNAQMYGAIPMVGDPLPSPLSGVRVVHFDGEHKTEHAA